MTWGVDLWDHRGRLEQHTQENIDNVEHYRSFASALAQVELDYSKALKAVHKKFAGHGQQDNSTAMQTWRSVLAGVEKIAAAHEQTSITLAGDISEHLKSAAKSREKERGQIIAELNKLDQKLAAEMVAMEKLEAKYQKYKKDSDAAMAAFEKAERADNVTKAKVEKARSAWVTKAKATDGIKVELDTEKKRVADVRFLHFAKQCPDVINTLEANDQNLWEAIVKAYHKMAMCFNYVRKANEESAQVVAEKAKQFNKVQDSGVFTTMVLGGKKPTPLPTDTPNQPESPPPKNMAPMTSSAPMSPPAAPEPVNEEPAEPQMPQCRILYDFPGTNDGELPASANEVLNIVSDDGSGWILAAKPGNMQQGYVPASYIEKF